MRAGDSRSVLSRACGLGDALRRLGFLVQAERTSSSLLEDRLRHPATKPSSESGLLADDVAQLWRLGFNDMESRIGYQS